MPGILYGALLCSCILNNMIRNLEYHSTQKNVEDDLYILQYQMFSQDLLLSVKTNKYIVLLVCKFPFVFMRWYNYIYTKEVFRKSTPSGFVSCKCLAY